MTIILSYVWLSGWVVRTLNLQSIGRKFESWPPLSSATKQYNLVPANGRWIWCLAAGKVTVGLASHWPCVTDNSGITTYGLTGLRKGDEHPAYTPVAVWHTLPLFCLIFLCKNAVLDWRPKIQCEMKQSEQFRLSTAWRKTIDLSF